MTRSGWYVVVAVLLPVAAAGQELSAADTAAVVSAALGATHAENGPLTELEVRPRCKRGDEPRQLQVPCGGEAVAEVLEAYAVGEHLNLVSIEDPLPGCGRGSSDATGASGLRRIVILSRSRPGRVHLEVRNTCSQGGGLHFIETTFFEAARIDGRWEVRAVGGFIT